MSTASSLGQIAAVPPRPGSRPRRPSSRLASALIDFTVAEVDQRQARRPGDVLLSLTLQPGRTAARAPDYELSDLSEAKLLETFSATMDRRHLGYGERFRTMKKHRPWYFLIGQPGAGGMHYHGLASVPLDKIEAFKTNAPWVWENLTQGGSLVIDDKLDAGWLDYATRHINDTPQGIAWHLIPHQAAPRHH